MRRDGDAIRRWNAAVREARDAAAERPLASGRPILLDNIFELDADAGEDIAPDGICPFLGQEAWVSATGRSIPAAHRMPSDAPSAISAAFTRRG